MQIHESMEKLRQQTLLLSKDVRLQESKRKMELKRQERMERQFLTQQVRRNLLKFAFLTNKVSNAAALYIL